jgi:hypothetical protein
MGFLQQLLDIFKQMDPQVKSTLIELLFKVLGLKTTGPFGASPEADQLVAECPAVMNPRFVQ